MEKLLKTKEDKEQFLLWIAFLKAGVFKQSIGAVQIVDKYCIIATLCVLLVPEETLITFSDNRLVGLNAQMNNMPEWARKINHHYAVKSGDDLYLMTLNDRLHLSFNQIADKLLETYVDELDS